MVEEILLNLYRIEIPLPGNPLKSLNSYLIKAPGRFLIIDTGMNREECAKKMFSSLEDLSVDLNKTDFFITHLHVDHAGLVGKLASSTSKIYFSEIDAAIINRNIIEKGWQEIDKLYKAHGFPEDELEKAMASHPGKRYSSRENIDYCLVKDNDLIAIGDYSFKCIETPGHTPGHMCLYEPEKKILVSGDHILFDITPNIISWSELNNSLKVYLASLDKVLTLDIDLVLPGHRNILGSHKKRIAELKAHHQARLDEVIFALKKGGDKTAYQIAPYITWDIVCSSWESFPPQQKIFAIGETIAHIEYLEESQIIQRKIKDSKILFSLA